MEQGVYGGCLLCPLYPLSFVLNAQLKMSEFKYNGRFQYKLKWKAK